MPKRKNRDEEQLQRRVLRYGRSYEPTEIVRSKRNTRNSEKVIYTAGYGNRVPGNPRSSMSAERTYAILQKDEARSLGNSLSHKVIPLAALDTEMKPKLKDQNISRDHILADSRIRDILHTSRKIITVKRNVTTEKKEGIRRFFVALCDVATGERLAKKFIESRRGNINDVVDEAAEGVLNLRFGIAHINTIISNQFDPIIVDGRLETQSAEIRDATMNLARLGLIDHLTAMNATATAKDRVTHMELSSSVISSATRHTHLGSRSDLDPFASPKSLAFLPRRASFSYGPHDESDLHGNTMMSLSREFHNTMRPAGSTSYMTKTSALNNNKAMDLAD